MYRKTDHGTYCYNSQYVHDENFDEMNIQSYCDSQNDDFDEIEKNEKDGDALLLSLVHEHPYLYNKKLTDFKDIVKKTECLGGNSKCFGRNSGRMSNRMDTT